MRLSVSLALALAISASGASGALARSGEEIYKTKCFVCHLTGAAGAPKIDDKAAWAPRIETGREALMYSVVAGKNAHPPKGTCMDCSTEELRNALEYMIYRVR